MKNFQFLIPGKRTVPFFFFAPCLVGYRMGKGQRKSSVKELPFTVRANYLLACLDDSWILWVCPGEFQYSLCSHSFYRIKVKQFRTTDYSYTSCHLPESGHKNLSSHFSDQEGKSGQTTHTEPDLWVKRKHNTEFLCAV